MDRCVDGCRALNAPSESSVHLCPVQVENDGNDVHRVTRPDPQTTGVVRVCDVHLEPIYATNGESRCGSYRDCTMEHGELVAQASLNSSGDANSDHPTCT